MEITCSRDKGSFSFYQTIALSAPEGEPITSKVESHRTLNVASPGFQILSLQAQKSKPGTLPLVRSWFSPLCKQSHRTAKLPLKF